MQCDKCHTKEATVHVSTVMHSAPHRDEHHLCPDCAEVGQTSHPLLIPVPEPSLSVGSMPVMSLSPQATARIDEVNNKLSELDPVIHAFCKRRGYAFHAETKLWPARRAWAHGEIRRCLHLTMNATFLDILKRGFWPELPWSLYASASLPLAAGQPIRTLAEEIFRGLPFSELATVLEQRLEDGFSILHRLTRGDVLAGCEMTGGQSVHRSWLPPGRSP
jgi:hypothetical protein